MSTKQITDRVAIETIIEQINAAERKLRMIKQYINPETGTIRDIQIVSGLYNGALGCIHTLGQHLPNFYDSEI